VPTGPTGHAVCDPDPGSVEPLAREIIQSGRLGRIVAVAGTALFHKRDDYFDLGRGWRRKPGGGPILINLIHDVKVFPAPDPGSKPSTPRPKALSAAIRSLTR
jgi:hypothetical protein